MADDEGRLFEPPPPVVKPAKDLYDAPRKTGKGYNHDENERVRALYKEHLRACTGAGVPEAATLDLGTVRGMFARSLVALAEKENVRYYEGTKPTHAKGSDAAVDSIATQLRQFWTDSMLPDYMLVLVEATICDRTNMALPGGFYSLQRRMVV